MNVAVDAPALGYSRAGLDAEPRPVDEHGLADAFQDALGASPAIPAAGAEQDGELVATQSDQQISVAEPCAEPSRSFAKELVARLMAKCVVDVLEIVDVDQHQRDPVFQITPLEASPPPLEQGAPVAETGEIVRDA